MSTKLEPQFAGVKSANLRPEIGQMLAELDEQWPISARLRGSGANNFWSSVRQVLGNSEARRAR